MGPVAGAIKSSELTFPVGAGKKGGAEKEGGAEKKGDAKRHEESRKTRILPNRSQLSIHSQGLALNLCGIGSLFQEVS